MTGTRLCVLLLAIPVALLGQSAWESSLYGNSADVQPPVQPGYVLMGGGRDVEEAFRWLIERAGRGDVVVLRASGTAAYNSYIVNLGADSSETIILRDREASSNAQVLDKVRRAEAIWIAGGDQWNYIRLWKDTPLHQALQRHVDAGRPIGGTSAGLAVLGEFYFSARHDGVRSQEAGLNPYHPKVTVETGFLRIDNLRRLVTDSHFSQRSRMLRTLAFLARLQKDTGSAEVRAIGVDEQTAVLVEPEGAARVVGKNPAYFLQTTRMADQCEQGKPLQLSGVRLWRVEPGGTFQLTAAEFRSEARPSEVSTNGISIEISGK
ncbi:MAG: cyanophycinase [Bryobacterales bacterium]|nr:cyanophycinase [Bryobacterales bacterium]